MKVESSSGHSRLRTVSPARCSGSERSARAPASSRVIGGLASARRPSQTPISPALTHQPALT
jgi:hypothetical protein